MEHSDDFAEPNTLPVPYKAKAGQSDLDYQERVWASGARGGGSVPADFEWRSNPKQRQEERGAGDGPKAAG